MLRFLRRAFGPLTRHPLGAALVLGAAVVSAGWVGAGVWAEREKQAAEDALAAYDFPDARRRLTRCLWLKPHDPDAQLLAVQAERRAGRLDYADDLLRKYGQEFG